MFKSTTESFAFPPFYDNFFCLQWHASLFLFYARVTFLFCWEQAKPFRNAWRMETDYLRRLMEIIMNLELTSLQDLIKTGLFSNNSGVKHSKTKVTMRREQ
jgi:hypothetical protein